MRISDWSSDVCSSDLYADTVRRDVSLSGGPLHQHPPWLPALFQGRETLSSGPCARREDHRRDGALCDVRSRRGADHRTGRGACEPPGDRESVGWGKSVSVRVDLGGRRIIIKKTEQTQKKSWKKK